MTSEEKEDRNWLIYINNVTIHIQVQIYQQGYDT